MRNRTNLWVCSFLLLVSGFSMAQQTSVIHGNVTDANGQPLPGVVLVIESSALQGSRSATSRETGEFLFRLLPPGNYSLTATMPGMQTQKQTINLGLGQTSRPRVVMRPETTSEELVVVASADPVLDTTDVVSNFTADFIDKIASGRTIVSRVALAPGTTTGGPNGSISISGAETYENLYLLNGGVFNFDNIRGTPGSAFIPDAIQETTVLSGSVSAEYGNFIGGVINTITKSGGNEFSGSLRASLTNDDWVARTPLELNSPGFTKNDKINRVYTLTAGGPILKDRLWFFVSGLSSTNKSDGTLVAASPLTDAQATALGFPTGQTAPGPRNISSESKDKRWEIKLTGKIVEGHDLVIDYTDRDIDATNDTSRGNLDLASVPKSRSIPESLFSVNYRGVITPELTIDAIYTKKQATFTKPTIDTAPDVRYTGTTLQDNNTGTRFFSPTFANGPPEDRDNNTVSLRANYFLISEGAGSHDLTFGLSRYHDYRRADNVQSASGYEFWNVYTVWNGDQVTPIFSGGQNGTNQTGVIYWPIQNSSLGADFQTDSAYINDRWTLNENWAFNIGVRYDKNDATAEDGKPASNSDNTSPRLAVEYDLRGDGKHKFSLSYAQYVARLTDTAQNASTAGSPTYVYWYYDGPITTNIADVFNYFETQYGAGATIDPLAPAGADFLAANIANNLSDPNSPPLTVVDPNLESPNAREYRVGYSTRWGKGFLKADFINREYADIYATFVNHDVGTVVIGGFPNDRRLLTNDDNFYRRKYNAVQLQGAWYLADNFTISGNYTWSQLYGNVVAETEGSGSISASTLTFYPEYNDFAQRSPDGRLSTDQRHVGRIFATYDLNTPFGDFNFSATERYESGGYYSAVMNIPLTAQRNRVTGEVVQRDVAYGFDPRGSSGYIFPPTSTSYYVSGRGEFQGENMTATNLGINYSLHFGRIEFFVEMNIYNLFNEDAAPYTNNGWYNTTVNTLSDPTTGLTNTFNVYTETPVRGTNYEFGSSFGQPIENEAYQTPRTFTMDFGFKF